MTDKELKRLNRAELLQLLMNQSVEIEQLQAKVEELTEQVQRQEITCQNVGSMAEAALALGGVFQAADQAAQKYIQEMADRAAHQEQELQAKAEEARIQADKLLEDANAAAAKIREEAEACLTNAKVQAEKILEEAKSGSQEYWDKVKAQIRTLLEAQETLKVLLETVGKN